MDVEGAFQTVAKPEGWNRNMASVCRIHDGPLLPLLTDTVHKLLDSPQAASLSPMEQMQYHYALAVFASYKGDMDQAIDEWQKCYSIDQGNLPDGVATMEEVLGSAYLHRSEMKNGLYTDPGDRCIFPPKNPREAFADPADSKMAIEYFLKYLKRKPDDLEVKWQLNLAYLTLGQYPSGVPPAVPHHRAGGIRSCGKHWTLRRRRQGRRPRSSPNCRRGAGRRPGEQWTARCAHQRLRFLRSPALLS